MSIRSTLLLPMVGALAMVPGLARAQDGAPSAGSIHAAQQTSTNNDVVLLKNGGKLRGTITEQMPGQYVVIQVEGGQSRRFAAAEVKYAGPIDEAPKAVPAAKAAAASADKPTVSVSTSAKGVTVAEITGHMVAQAGDVVAVGTAWRDICTAPCEFKLDPGLHELMIHGDGFPSASKKVDLRHGETDLVAKPGSSGLELLGDTLLIVGGAAAVLGATFFFVNTKTEHYNSDGTSYSVESGTHKIALPLLLGGLAGAGTGIALGVVGSSSLDERDGTHHTAMTTHRAHIAYGVSYHGAF